ncbi:MAG: hypothetical protein KC503_30205 [Myxococcales bacterium]|nr:hypothetical protein [Myxococcales bacterium]
MLEHVSPNQTRFVAPGLSPDARGVALGRFVCVLLPSIDRVVGLFRGLSEGVSLDELLPSMKVLQVRTPLQSREFIVLLPVTNSYAADQISAVAALVGGLTFTGSAKHFVRYRDSRAPLGYDVDTLHSDAQHGGGDYVLYAGDFVQAYHRDREVAFGQLVFNLSLQAVRSDNLRPGEEVLLRVVRGLWRFVLSYLHRNNVRCAAAACEAPEHKGGRFFLLRATDLPRRMVELFSETPGVEVHRFKTQRVAVQLGYRHPVELSSCASIFDDESLYLFSGQRDTLDITHGKPAFVDAAALVQLGAAPRPMGRDEQQATSVEEVSVPLRLVPSYGATPPIVAARLTHQSGPYLKKLVYVLPPRVLGGYRVSVTSEHIYLLNESGVDFIPLGEMFHAVAPGVMAPVGFQLIPRVYPDVLLSHLGGGADQLFFFCRESPAPVQLSRARFAPLSRTALAKLEVLQPHTTDLSADEPKPAELVNAHVGSFPLWGFSADE